MAFIDTTYVDNAIGTATRLALAPTTAAFTQYEGQARSKVVATAAVAGYSLGTASSNDLVRLLTMGQWYFFAGGMRKGLEVPPAIADAIDMLDQLRGGQLPIPGLSPSARDGVSGVAFSATTGADGRPQYFSRRAMRTW